MRTTTTRTRGLGRHPSIHETSHTHRLARERRRAPPGERRKRLGLRGPRGRDEGEEDEEGEIHDDEDDDDDDDSGSRHSYGGLEIAIDHVTLYDWLLKWTKEYGIPGTTPLGVFNTLCLDGPMASHG